MARIKASTRRRLLTMMRKFKFEEFEKTVLPLFPEITWSEIRSRLMKRHQCFNSNDAAKVIEQKLDACEIDDKELNGRLAQLQVLEVSRHSKRKFWYGYELKGERTNPENFIPNHELQDRIQRCFLRQQKTMIVQLTTYHGITYASLTEKRKSRLQPSAYVAFFLRQGYFFCARKNPTKDFLQTIVESLGYSGGKKLSLMGKDLPSLMKMLQLKKQGVVDIENLWNPPVYKPAKPIFRETGIDFRQHEQRRKHLEKFVGEDPPTMNILSATCADASWEDQNPKLANLKIQLGWEFKSPNVPETLLRLAEKRILVNPLPNYITKWMESGKNHLKLAN